MAEPHLSKLQAALSVLRALRVAVRGPFVTPKEQCVYVVDTGIILTDAEIVALYESEKFTRAGIGPSLAEVKSLQGAESYPQNHRRSQRVMLRLDVLVRFEIRDGNPQQTHAFTVSVNTHGGLLESPFRMTVGQSIALMNPQNGKEVACTVVSVQSSSERYFRIAFEFTQPIPCFWEIAFPPSDWGMSKETA
jgi:hypothetical protein